MNEAVAPPCSRKTKSAGAAAAVQTEPARYLTFLLGGEMFAIDILGVKEIIEYRNITPVPMMPSSMRGVISLRGVVVPVMDLQVRFGKSPGEVGRRACLVIVEVPAADGCQIMGVIVDAVCEVIDIATSDIEPAPAVDTRIRRDFILGIGKVKGKLVILLDVLRALSPGEVGALASISLSALQANPT